MLVAILLLTIVNSIAIVLTAVCIISSQLEAKKQAKKVQDLFTPRQ